MGRRIGITDDKKVRIKPLLADMDRLVDSFSMQGRRCPRITLDRRQYEAFIDWSDGHPFYRDVPVICQ